MRQLRTFFCGFSFVAAAVALALHLGLNLWTCASCSFVNEQPISGPLAWLGPAITGALAVASYLDKKQVGAAIGICTLGSLALVGWMLSNNSVCKACLLVHLGVISAALTFVPKAKFLAPAVFSFVIAFVSTEGLEHYIGANAKAVFQPREAETIPDGPVYVLYTDPECSRCQMAEAAIEKLETKPNILYRWILLPQNLYRTIRAAAVLESARIESPKAFDSLRIALFTTPGPLTDEQILSAAKRAGLEQKARGWLASPDVRALTAIEGDQQYTKDLQIESLPALAMLSAPDATGTRTLVRVPFSAIGLGQ